MDSRQGLWEKEVTYKEQHAVIAFRCKKETAERNEKNVKILHNQPYQK